jgi:hypothetical protein
MKKILAICIVSILLLSGMLAGAGTYKDDNELVVKQSYIKNFNLINFLLDFLNDLLERFNLPPFLEEIFREYFGRYEVSYNPCIVNLPTYMIYMHQYHPATDAFFDAWFWGITGDFDIENNVHYDGWCIDHDTPLPNGNDYEVYVYSSYCPPTKFLVDTGGNTVDWGKINHIINHRIGSANDIQAAIRHFVNFGDNPNWPGPDNQANYDTMVNNAQSSYVPGPGDVVAVIVDTNPSMEMDPYHPYQYLIVEIPVPEPYEGLTPGFWKTKGVKVGWPLSYNTDMTLAAAGFIIPGGSMDDNKKRQVDSTDTLLEALNYKGGWGVSGMAQSLLRAATAALLNAAHGEVNYPLTVGQIIFDVNTALASGNRDTMETLKDTLDSNNNLGADDWW